MAGGSGFESALRRARELVMRNEPSEDVDGLDALYKAVILMGFGMGHWADCGSINPCQSVTLRPRTSGKPGKRRM